MASKSAKKLRADSDSNIIQNKVHQLIEYIESNFADESVIKERFATAALTGALKFLEEISDAKEISNQTKVKILTRIYAAVSRHIEYLSEPQIPTPLAYWDERTDRSMRPSAFVIANYPTYGRGLTRAQVRSADRELYQALHSEKSRHGWPPNFSLAAVKETNDLVVSDPSMTLAGLNDLPPNERKERRRISSARQYRRRKGRAVS